MFLTAIVIPSGASMVSDIADYFNPFFTGFWPLISVVIGIAFVFFVFRFMVKLVHGE